MKVWTFACVLFYLAFLLSCSDENLPSDELPLSLQKISNRISPEEAIDYVEEARAFLDEQSPSESRSSRAVNSVSALLFGDVKASAMKSDKYKELGISDTLAYIFNFGDSLGFVIVSKDKRVETPLFAFTEKGTLLNGKTNNPGLALFLKRLEGYVLKSIAESGKDDEKKEAMTVLQKGPLFPFGARPVASRSVPVTWGQGMPFNNNVGGQCSNHTGNNKYWAGCVATATAQIMSYWKYPTTLGGTTYNWTTLNSYKHKNDFNLSPTVTAMVADLFQKIGTGVNMDYGCSVSLAYTEDAIEFLINKGFTLYGNPNNAKLRNYDNMFIQMALQDYGPLIANGCDASGKGCHAWVIDGMVYIYVPLGLNAYSIYYVRNNWGWDGYEDGYYLETVYDPDEFNFNNIKVGLVYR